MYQDILQKIETNKNLFITGKAGTGKSTILMKLKDQFKKDKKKAVFLAPTGVASVNIEGETIHRFFKFRSNICYRDIKYEKDTIYREMQILVIDEISMVRADLMDYIDYFLKLNRKNELPFGGVQVIVVGDLHQLPPVVTGDEKHIFYDHYNTPYFFSASCFDDLDFDIIDLQKVYRQQDQNFVSILNQIRTGDTSKIQAINSRYNQPLQEPFITLCATNAVANQVNQHKNQAIAGKEYSFKAFITGDVPSGYYPVPEVIKVKVGSQVMMSNNDMEGGWYNGMLGTITNIQNDIVEVLLEVGKTVYVGQHTWKINKYVLEKGQINTAKIGEFTQYPFILAFAVTIHKSQGKTFDKVLLDVGNGCFAHGQLYVALSRVTSLQGLSLKTKIKERDVIVDKSVNEFLIHYL